VTLPHSGCVSSKPAARYGPHGRIHSQSVRLLDGALDLPIAPDHDRRVEPRETLASLLPHFDDLGITRLGELTGLDTLGIPVAFAVRPNSFTLSINLGKGLDRDSALTSAAMEAAETAIAERPPQARIRTSLRDLYDQSEAVVDLSRIARCQPERFHCSEKIDWVEGRDIVTGTPVLVPWALAGFDHRLQIEGYHDAFEVSSDGLASGNTKAEAVLHGIYELIERDSYALLELFPEDDVSRRLCDPMSIGDSQISRLVHSIWDAGLRVQLLDMTSDISVPAYTVLLASTASNGVEASLSPPIYAGCGCHLLPRRAIIRALTEAAQARLAFVAGARDDFDAGHYESTRTILGSASLNFLGSQGMRIGMTNQDDSHTIGEGIEHLIGKLSAAGIHEIVVVELSAPGSPISVVRVIIPDLQIPLHGHRTQVSRRGLRQLLNVKS
jgi:YcaO-like protein with predicted kinase domain